jgi:hypothetical protein
VIAETALDAKTLFAKEPHTCTVSSADEFEQQSSAPSAAATTVQTPRKRGIGSEQATALDVKDR